MPAADGGAPAPARDMLGEAWDALVAGSGAGAGGRMPVRPPVSVTGAAGALPSAFAVEEVALSTVALALMAAAALAGEVPGLAAHRIAVDRGQVAGAVRSERHFRVGDDPGGMGFAPLSRFWHSADGWVRTHANYPWHRAALLAALGVEDEPDAPQAVARALGELLGVEVEDRVVAAGGVAAAVRTVDEWRVHPQGAAVHAEPLIAHERMGDAPPRPRPASVAGGPPAAGVRVLDLTRVIAGPVCTRYLGALGADVLRIDPLRHPDMAEGALADTLLAKRSAALDMRAPDGRAALDTLLGSADVVVCGYRPGSLDRFGLGAGDLAERHPGLVAVYLAAWGHRGPWSERRGFDSVVQAPTGIAIGESPDGTEPGALPCQLLDHGTGYLAAAAVLDGLRRQRSEGGTHIRRLSLARTGGWLTSAAVGPGPDRPHPDPDTDGRAVGAPDAQSWLVERGGRQAEVSAVAPPGSLGGRPLRWPGPPSAYCADAPAWSS